MRQARRPRTSTTAPNQSARDHPRLFRAINEVFRVLTDGGDARDALRRSFENAVAGLAAEKGILLVVEESGPLRLRSRFAHGFTRDQIRSCERGDSTED